MSYSAADRVWDGNNTLGDTTDLAARADKLGRAKARVTVPTAGIAIGAFTTDLSLPKDAIVKAAYYRVRTTFTSATDAATIAVGVEGATDLVAATAISAGSNSWDAGSPVDTIADGTVANFIECSATLRRSLTVTVAVEDLTAGEMDIWVEWEMP